MNVYVLLYEAGKDSEGIHSLEIKGQTIVLMFENQDDAERYSVLLEAQDFPKPTVESIQKSEIESFCIQSGYEPTFVKSGFLPKTDEERLLLVPPPQSKDVTNWNDDNSDQTRDNLGHDLEEIKKRLENLL